MARYTSVVGLVAAIIFIPLSSVADIVVTKPLPREEQKALKLSEDRYVSCLDAAATKFDDARSGESILVSKIAHQCAKEYREMAMRTRAQIILKPDPKYRPSRPSHDPYAGMIPDGHMGIASNLTQATSALRISRCGRKYGENTSAAGDCFAILDGRPGDAQDKNNGWP